MATSESLRKNRRSYLLVVSARAVLLVRELEYRATSLDALKSAVMTLPRSGETLSAVYMMLMMSPATYSGSDSDGSPICPMCN